MSYHETFWVVVGTAAPVVALAAVVSLPDTLRLLPAPWQAGTIKWGDWRVTAIQWCTIGNVVAQAGVLAISLTALAYNRDMMPPWVGIALTAGGILLLAVLVWVTAQYRRLVFEALTSRPQGEGGKTLAEAIRQAELMKQGEAEATQDKRRRSGPRRFGDRD